MEANVMSLYRYVALPYNLFWQMLRQILLHNLQQICRSCCRRGEDADLNVRILYEHFSASYFYANIDLRHSDLAASVLCA